MEPLQSRGLALEHAVEGGAIESRFKNIAASSNRKRNLSATPPVYGIISKVRSANGTDLYMPSGAPVRMTLQDWLAAATTASASTVANVSLGAYNADISPDYREPSRYPPFRSSGVRLETAIVYDNLNPLTNKPEPDNEQVYATITLTAKTEQWAGSA